MNKIPKPPAPPPVRVVKDGGSSRFDFIFSTVLLVLSGALFLIAFLVGGIYGR